MRDLFRNLHLENNFYNKQPINIGNITDTIHENARATWLDSITRKPKLRTYATFKSSFNTENYVKFCTNRQDRSLMARTRLGILPIMVEMGHYKNIPTTERLCESCGELEDELHFLLHCNLYVYQRQELVRKAERGTVSFHSLPDLKNVRILCHGMWKDTCSYIREIWKLRTKSL